MSISHKNQKGFSLIEVLVGSALFLVVAIAAYSAYASLFKVAQANQSKLLALSLASEQLEFIRGMSYVDIGILPATQEQDVVRGNMHFTVKRDVSDEASQTSLPNGGKLIEVDVSCASCKNFSPVVLTGEVTKGI